MYEHLHVHMCAMCKPHALGGQERVSDPLELGLIDESSGGAQQLRVFSTLRASLLAPAVLLLSEQIPTLHALFMAD